MLLLVPAYPGSPGQRPLNVCVCFIIPAKVRDYVFTGVGLSVCLFVCLFVCLSVCFLPRSLNKTWTDLEEILGKVPRGKSKPKFVFGYDR